MSAAGFTPDDRVVTTVEDFQAIPDGAIFLTWYGDPIRMDCRYREMKSSVDWPASTLPVRVIGVSERGEPS